MSAVLEAQEVDIGPAAQIPPGEGRNFQVGGIRMAVFRTHGGEVFATQAQCPHRNGPLADGLLGGANVICPLHDRVYDLRTGAGSDGGLITYPARLTKSGTIAVKTRGSAPDPAKDKSLEPIL